MKRPSLLALLLLVLLAFFCGVHVAGIVPPVENKRSHARWLVIESIAVVVLISAIRSES